MQILRGLKRCIMGFVQVVVNRFEDTMVDHWSCFDRAKPVPTTFWVHVTKILLYSLAFSSNLLKFSTYN